MGIAGVALVAMMATSPSPAQAVACPGSLTGGTVTTVGNDCVLQFTTVGSYTWTPPVGITTADVLVVGGGGGGGNDAAGGGGAGGYIYQQNVAVSGNIAVAVGAGGVGGRNSPMTLVTAGAQSSFGAIVAAGGGKGGTYNGGAGGAGASGGGGAFVDGVAGTGTNGQGFSGGAGGNQWSCTCPAGGGGGGAGGVGLSGNTSDGNGGPGLQNSITGTSRWYAAGGGGGRWNVVTNIENGGSGIGGRGAGSCGANPSTPGTANTGSGGGGAPAGCQTFGSAGGSGIVIVRYSLPDVVAPSFVSASLNAAGSVLTLTIDEALSSTTASGSDFTVVADTQSMTISSVTVVGSTVRLSMSTPIWSGAYVTVAYSDPTVGNDTNAVQDVAGNDLPSFSATAVTNNSTATTTTTTTTSTTTTTTTTTSPPSLVIDLRTSTSVASQGQSAVATVAPTSVPASLAKGTSPTTSSTSIAPTTTIPAPGEVKTGEAMVQSGDVLAHVQVARENNVVVVKFAGSTARFAGLDSKGNITPLDAAGTIDLKPGSHISLKADGFEPESLVEAWLFSTPQKIGQAHADSQGNVDASFVIPKNAPSGAHRIVVNSVLKNGDPSTFTLGIAVTRFSKGKSVTPWIIGIPIVLAVFSGLFLPPALRRRRRDQNA